MEKIEKRDGFVYLVKGDKGFETYYNMGKDIDDPRWYEDDGELDIIEKGDKIEIVPKKRKQKKSED